MLAAMNDSGYRTTLVQYEEILQQEGFVEVLSIPFSEDGNNECFCVFYQPKDGVLLAFDTYSNQTTINGGYFYYNWMPHLVDGQVTDYPKYDSKANYDYVTTFPPTKPGKVVGRMAPL